VQKRAIVYVITKQVGQEPMPLLILAAEEIDREGFENVDNELNAFVGSDTVVDNDDSDDDDDEDGRDTRSDGKEDDGFADEVQESDEEADSDVDDV
jgi:hypothetical protein